MKKWLQVLVTLAFVICSILLINAQSVEAADKITSKNGQWEYEADYFNNTCTVIAYKGDAVDLVIPSKIDGLTVTKIGTDGSSSRFPKNIVSVSIPSKVSVIGNNSFSELKNLRNVNLPSKLEKIGMEAFFECESLEEIRIPKSVSYVGDNAFAFSGIKKLVVEGNPWLDDGCFWYCKNLKDVSMPEYKGNEYEDGTALFSDCTSLKKVNMPKVQCIPASCFFNCQSLEKIKFPSCLKKIGSYAFVNTSLKNVDLPDTLSFLGEKAFLGTKLSSLVIPCGVSNGVEVGGDLSNIDIYVLNPECSLYNVSQTCTIYGFKDSQAYKYAKYYGIRFVQLKGISSVKITRKGNASVFSWKKVSGVKSYTLFIYNYKENSYQKIATTKKNTYTDKSESDFNYLITYQFKKNGKTLTGGFPVHLYY